MEPLHPKLRNELKRAHPGLTDEDIDRYEELLSRRFALDPEENADEINKLDLERIELMRQKMPRYKEISQVFSSKISRKKRGPKTRIKIKPPEKR